MSTYSLGANLEEIFTVWLEVANFNNSILDTGSSDFGPLGASATLEYIIAFIGVIPLDDIPHKCD